MKGGKYMRRCPHCGYSVPGRETPISMVRVVLVAGVLTRIKCFASAHALR